MPEVWERPRRPPCSVVGQAAHDLYCDTETKRRLLLQGGGFARIFEQSAPAAPLFVDAEELGRETVPAETP